VVETGVPRTRRTRGAPVLQVVEGDATTPPPAAYGPHGAGVALLAGVIDDDDDVLRGQSLPDDRGQRAAVEEAGAIRRGDQSHGTDCGWE